jgi:WD40 repeat protein
LRGHTGPVRDVTFSRDGSYLASSAGDPVVRLWDVQTRQEVYAFGRPTGGAYLNSLSFSPDGSLLASPQGVWEVQSRAVVHEMNAGVWHVAFSPDGLLLATSVVLQPIRLLDTLGWVVVRTVASQTHVEPTGNDTFGFEFSPAGTLLASGGLGGVARVFRVADGALERTLPAGAADVDVHDVAFSPDGQLLAIGGQAPTVRLFRVADGALVKALPTGEGTMSLDFAQDGRTLAIATEGVVRLWDAELGTLLQSLPHAAAALSVGFSPDGRFLACGLYDGTVALWAISG